MESYKLTAILVTVVTWIEFVLASLVVFLDPGYNDFPYSTIVFTWPGVLEEIHRLWAVVLIVVFVINLVVVLLKLVLNHAGGREGLNLLWLSTAAFVLLILQAVLGGITIYSQDHPLNVILHEGNAGVLMLVSSLLTAYALFAFHLNGRQAKQASP